MSPQKGAFVQDSFTTSIDDADYRILRALSDDARASDVTIGERIHLSSSSVARRRKAMEESGIIVGYDARLDMEKLGFGGVVVVSIELASQTVGILNEFELEVVKCPSVSYCGFVSGDTDFILLIHVSSFNNYDTIYRQELSILPHVARIRSSFVLRQVSRRANPPAILATRGNPAPGR
jgi:Lrp/AsnC family transcriptional regulator, leucine-responsive regulatory protein